MELEFPPGTPDDVQEYLTKQFEQQQMQRDSHVHTLYRLFSELTLEQLQTFAFLMDLVENDPNKAGFFEGLARGAMSYRFNLCMACGVDHDKALEENIEATMDEMTKPDDKIGGHVQVPQWHPSSGTPPPIALAEANVVELDPLANRCNSCGGDQVIRLGCPHPMGSHGQERTPCPEPVTAPCPECQTPAWFTQAELPVSLCHSEVQMLPLDEPGVFVCAECFRKMNFPI